MDLTKKRKLDGNGNSAVYSSTPSLSPDDAYKLLSTLSPSQLLTLLRSAVLLHPDVLSAVRTITDSDPSQRKLFIRGLGWETTTESLLSTFSSYGEIEEAVVITDKVTGKSKGYGFVTFKHMDGAILALKEGNKKIDGRMTVTQLAAAKGGGNEGRIDVNLRKIYVGNIPYKISSERLLQLFSMYGEIEEGPLGFEKQMGKEKGFAFFVYKTEEGSRAALCESVKNLDGYELMCKLASDNKRGKNGGSMGQGGVPGSGTGFGVPSGYSGFQQPGMGGNGGLGFGSQGGGYAGAGYGQYGSGYGSGTGTGEYGAGFGHSVGYRMPPSSTGMPTPGGYRDVGNYGPPPAYGSQGPQPGAGPRVPPGLMYPPPYY